MLGLRATRAARFPCPYSPSSSSQAASLSGLARLAPLAVASPAPSPAALSLLVSASPSARPISATWGSAMRPAVQPRPSTRVLCTAASSAPREGKEVLVQHLLVGEKDARLLVDLEKSIASGVDLSDLAVEHSLCPSKDNGGMLGWVRRGQMVPEFEEAAFSAPLKKVVRCKTKFGWHLVQVLSERDQCMLQDIAPEELHAKMQDPSFIEEAQLIDVREPDEVCMKSNDTSATEDARYFSGRELPFQVSKFYLSANSEPGDQSWLMNMILKKTHMFCATMACAQCR